MVWLVPWAQCCVLLANCPQNRPHCAHPDLPPPFLTYQNGLMWWGGGGETAKGLLLTAFLLTAQPPPASGSASRSSRRCPTVVVKALNSGVRRPGYTSGLPTYCLCVFVNLGKSFNPPEPQLPLELRIP